MTFSGTTNYSVVILFYDIEFSRPVMDGMFVESDEPNDTRPVGMQCW
jgi:hypothetical protein